MSQEARGRGSEGRGIFRDRQASRQASRTDAERTETDETALPELTTRLMY